MIHDVHNIDRAVKYYTALTPHTVPHMEPLILHLSCTTLHTSEMSGISPCVTICVIGASVPHLQPIFVDPHLKRNQISKVLLFIEENCNRFEPF